ncbi:MAG: AI-2E family transporter [Bacillota bacterium]|nr:AI-2E family transporter [Bacillota bacterium]
MEELGARERWVQGILALLLFLAVPFVLRLAWPAILPFLVGGALAFLLMPSVNYLTARGLPRWLATALLFLLLLGMAVLLVVLVLPALLDEVERLTQMLPAWTAKLSSLWDRWLYQDLPVKVPPTLMDRVEEAWATWEEKGEEWFQDRMEQAGHLVETFFFLVLSPFVAFYMLADWPRFRQVLLRWIPARQRTLFLRYVLELDRMLAGYIRGQIFLSLAVGTLTALALAILGLPYWLLLGLVAAAGELIPYVGPFLGAIPALLVAASQSSRQLLLVAVVFLFIQQMEGAVMGPAIMRTTLGFHPLVVIFALLLGGHFFGFLGVLLALPALGFLVVTVRFLYRLFTQEPVP